MKSVFFNRTTKTSVDSVMTPMIDVVFLLLIFFLASASFQRLEKSLPSSVAAKPDENTPGNQPDTALPESLSDLSEVVVRIRPAEGAAITYMLNEETYDNFGKLAPRITSILKVRNDVPIIIDPENAIPAGEAIRVYDYAKANGAIAVYLVAR
jgi:biopolymer transport protein ExbD